MTILGSRVPNSLKLFLLTLAIIDDLGAIVIIAIFYTGDLSYVSLALAGVSIVVLAAMNLLGVRRIAAYMNLSCMRGPRSGSSGPGSADDYCTRSGTRTAGSAPRAGS